VLQKVITGSAEATLIMTIGLLPDDRPAAGTS
jgi:hypothetical protein